jgi:hypothetical protein
MSDVTEVKVIKLANGQELIAKVVNGLTGGGILVESPLSLQPMRTENGLAVGLIPFTFGGKNSGQIKLAAEHVLCIMDAESDLESQYLGAISGLVLPQGQANPKVLLT